MNLKSTAQSVFILLSERDTRGSCSLSGSCSGSLLGPFSIELQGEVWVCCRGREAEESEIKGTISFAHQSQDYLAIFGLGKLFM